MRKSRLAVSLLFPLLSFAATAWASINGSIFGIVTDSSYGVVADDFGRITAANDPRILQFAGRRL